LFIEFIFPASFGSQGVLGKDPAVWIDGARALTLLVLPLTENEFDKVIIVFTWFLQTLFYTCKLGMLVLFNIFGGNLLCKIGILSNPFLQPALMA
jgi:hypothetical protein